jgi:PAS domain S-box-containing protein
VLPGQDALGCCRAIKADPALAGIPLWMLGVASADEPGPGPCFEAGADEYIAHTRLAEELGLRVQRQLQRPTPPQTPIISDSTIPFRQLFEKMHAGYSLNQAIFNQDGRMVDARTLHANDAFENQAGPKPSDIIGHTLLELQPATNPIQLTLYEKTVLTGEPHVIEYYSQAYQRHLREHIIRPKPGQFATVVEDISLEKRLSAHNAFMASLLDQVQNAVVAMDLNYRVLYWNQYAETLLGWSKTEAIGTSILEMILPEKSRELTGRSFNNILAQGSWHNQLDLLRKDGSHFPAEITATPLQGLDGTLIGFVGIAADVSQRHLAQQDLELFFNIVPDMACIASLDGYFTQLNPAWERSLGYSRAELLSQPMFNFIHPADLETTADAIRQLASNQRVTEFVNRYRTKAGGYRWLEWSANPSPDGQTIFAVAHDITERKRGEQILRDSESHLRSIIDTIPGFIWTAQPDGSVTYLNQGWLDFAGLSLEQALGQGWAQALHPDDAAPSMEAWINAAQAGKPYEVEQRLRARDGQYHWFLTRTQPAYDQQGNVLAWYGINTDITSSKTSAQALQQSETRYRTILDTSPVPMAINDPEGTILYLNQAFLKNFGYTLEDIPTLRDWWPRAYPDPLYQQSVADDWQAALEKSLRSGRDFEAMDVIIHCKDGSDKSALVSAAPIKSDGTDVHLVILVDISALKQAQAALRESERRFHGVMDGMKEGVILLGFDWRYLYINQEAELQNGRPASQLLGRTVQECWPSIEQTDFFQVEALVMADREARQVEGPFTFSEQGERWFEWRIQPADEGLLVLTFDITARKHIELALQEAHDELEQHVLERTAQLRDANLALERALQAKDEFMAMMSHELRTPLTAILGLSESLLINHQNNLNEKQARGLKIIASSGTHLLKLINEIIDFTRLQTNSLDLPLADCQLDGVCRACLRMAENQAQENGVVISYNIEPAIIVLHSDEKRLRQIINNLLENAIKFTSRAGTVSLEVTGLAAEGCVRIDVSDNGIGIKNENLQRLFKPFLQLDARLSRQYNGTGLGLAMVKALVEHLGGSVAVSSTFGQGSCFSVRLPWTGNPPSRHNQVTQ